MQSQPHGIRVQGLAHTYTASRWFRAPTRTQALRDISFEVAPGEVVGLVGPNGAGKSTLIRILSTLLTPQQGEAWVGTYSVAHHPHRVRATLGVVGDAGFYRRLSAMENLRFFAALQGHSGTHTRKRLLDALHRVDLAGQADVRADRLSDGMRQRLLFARALVHNPRILLLDEPERSLDPGARTKLYQLINELRSQVDCIFLATHQLEALSSCCDRVLVLDGGALKQQGTPEHVQETIRSVFERHAHTEETTP